MNPRTVFRFVVRALIALNHGNAERALEPLRPAAAYGATESIQVYVRSTAYLRAGKAQEALHEFQRIRDLQATGPVILSFRSLFSARRAGTNSWVTPPKPALPIRISSLSGRTPIPTSPS